MSLPSSQVKDVQDAASTQLLAELASSADGHFSPQSEAEVVDVRVFGVETSSADRDTNKTTPGDIQEAILKQLLAELASSAVDHSSSQEEAEINDLRTFSVESSSADRGADEATPGGIQEAVSTQLLSELASAAGSTPPPQMHGLETLVVKASEANHEKPQKSNFFRLPAEVRRVIYEMCLVPDGRPPLRCPETIRESGVLSLGPSQPPTKIQLCDNGVLRACRLIYDEAIPVFYTCNTFHHLLTGTEFGQDASMTSSSELFLRNLRRMRYVSVDTCQVTSDPWSDSHNPTADRKLSYFLDELRRQCAENLHGLEIQLLCQHPYSLLGGGASSKEIRGMLPHLRCLTIVSYGPFWRDPSSIQEFCWAIAQDECWDKKRFSTRGGLPKPHTVAEYRHSYSQDDTRTSRMHIDCWQISTATNQDLPTEAEDWEPFSPSKSESD